MFSRMQTTVFLITATMAFTTQSHAWAAACENQRSEAEALCLSKEIRKPDKKDADFTYRNRCNAKAATAYRSCLSSLRGSDGCAVSKAFIEKVTSDGGNLYHKFDDYRRGGLNVYQALVKLAGTGTAVQTDLLKCKAWSISFLKRVAPSAACEATQKQITHVLNHNLAAREAFDGARMQGQTPWIAMQPQINRLANGKQNIAACGGWAPVYLTRHIAPMVGIILPNSLKAKAKKKGSN